MRIATRLQFSTFGKRAVRAAAWVALTLAVGLMLAILFTPQLAVSGPTEATSPGGHQIKQKSGPWVYRSVSTPV
jgi:hypothetical protein